MPLGRDSEGDEEWGYGSPASNYEPPSKQFSEYLDADIHIQLIAKMGKWYEPKKLYRVVTTVEEIGES